MYKFVVFSMFEQSFQCVSDFLRFFLHFVCLVSVSSFFVCVSLFFC